MPPSPLETVITFLAEIGIPGREDALPDETFLPGVCISQGTLIFGRSRLKWPGDPYLA